MPQVVDETDFGFGWISPEKPKLRMASHALAGDGGVWLVDPTDEPAHLPADVRDVALGYLARMPALADRGVLGRKAERVEAHRP